MFGRGKKKRLQLTDTTIIIFDYTEKNNQTSSLGDRVLSVIYHSWTEPWIKLTLIKYSGDIKPKLYMSQEKVFFFFLKLSWQTGENKMTFPKDKCKSVKYRQE